MRVPGPALAARRHGHAWGFSLGFSLVGGMAPFSVLSDHTASRAMGMM